MLLLAILSQVLLLSSSTAADDGPIVKTDLGRVRGYTLKSKFWRQFYAFSGIPYAKPPVGKLRFQAPLPVEPWEGVLNATKDGPICIQYLQNMVIGQEDCLYLSVYSRNLEGSQPVLVHIHGGAYKEGDQSFYGPHYLMDENIVVVNINYRLGVFGFFTLESPEMPGNQGVKDQVLALKWVKDNIASFGGNPNLVTIIGESAGGASVYNHLISPRSKGLFHRVISESGTSYAAWGVAPPGYRKSVCEQLLTLMNCSTDPTAAIPCISAKLPEYILFRTLSLKNGLLSFGPVIEEAGKDSFISGLPSEWKHNPAPLLIGTTSAEGLLLTSSMASKDYDYKKFSSTFNQAAPDILGYSATASNPDQVTKAIRRFYLKNEEITADDFANLTMVVSDVLFTIPIIEGADKHSRFAGYDNDVYFYYFDFRIPVPGEDKRFAVGAPHTAEALYIWNISAFGYDISKDPRELHLSNILVKTVTSFMINGKPSIIGFTDEWKKWTPDSHNYIHIDLDGFHLEKGLADNRVKFWKSIDYMDKYRNSSGSAGFVHSTILLFHICLFCGYLLLKEVM